MLIDRDGGNRHQRHDHDVFRHALPRLTLQISRHCRSPLAMNEGHSVEAAAERHNSRIPSWIKTSHHPAESTSAQDNAQKML
ncbi:hypothetical protein WJ971_26075 [Achromobacter xylosoxidans]